MDLAYPGGATTIVAERLPYYEMAADRPLEEYVPPAKLALGVCQKLSPRPGVICGYEFRLGSTAHKHLKLRVQCMPVQFREVWVYSVDTHDGFLQATHHPNAEEAAAARLMVEQNRQLKYVIEQALSQAGFMTPKNLLQLELTAPA
jgi:hypothetical protein